MRAWSSWIWSLLPRLAAAVGLAIALAGAIALPKAFSPKGDAVARVNGVGIPRAALDHALARLAAPATPADREAVVQRLVDEEILVQRALEIGLVEADPNIRKALVRAAIDEALRGAATDAPDEAALRSLYQESPGIFTRSRLARVRVMSFRDIPGGDTGKRRGEEAAAALASGADFDDVALRLGDGPGLPVPDELLPEAALRRVLGPALSEAALALPAGGTSRPLRAGDAVHLLRVVEAQPARTASFESVRDAVRVEWQRRRGESALDALLAELRSRARISYAADAPSP